MKKIYDTKEDLIFAMVTTYGFPLECIEELLEEKGFTYDKQKYNELWEKHRNISRANRTRQIFS